MRPSRILTLCLLAAFIPALSQAESFSALTVTIRPRVDGSPLLLDSLRYENAEDETFSVARLSTLFSGFAFERKDGGFIELPDQLAWIDAAKRRLTFNLTNIPPGEYRAFRFHLGLDPESNRRDPASLAPAHPLNPAMNGLHWSWRGEYIFLALEGRVRGGVSQPEGYSFHFAEDRNRTRIDLPGKWDLRGESGALIDLDVAAILNAPRSISFSRDGNSTHSREEDPIAAALKANLPGAFRLAQISPQVKGVTNSNQAKPLFVPSNFTPYPLRISNRFPIPKLPSDNPLLIERVRLGQRLFNEPRLSRDNSVACASCHLPSAALSDPRRHSLGIGGRTGNRNAMPLFNLALKDSFFWDGRAPSLSAQALMPIEDHLEMDEKLVNVVAKLTADPGYTQLFSEAFTPVEITPEKIGLAVENFVLTLTSFDSKFDQAMRGAAKLTPLEKRGFELFMTEYEPRTGRLGADCFHCHGGALFTDHQFHNNGLSNTGDIGRESVTGNPRDRHRFATPSLRNIALTAPYMHDGRFATLEKVIAHYTSGVHRSETLDPNLAKHPPGGIPLPRSDQRALIAFLQTLTDPQFSSADHEPSSAH